MKSFVLPLPAVPDALCDQMADAVIDEYLRRDPQARARVSVFGSHGMVVVGGEVVSSADFDVAGLIQTVYASAGFDDAIEVFATLEKGTDPRAFGKDPVVVRGYAVRETKELLPRGFVYLRQLAASLFSQRLSDLSFLRLDGSLQLVMQQDVVRSLTMVVGHDATRQPSDVQRLLLQTANRCLPLPPDAHVFVNPEPTFTTTGFARVAGGSGRGIERLGYGGFVPASSQAPTGRDPRSPERAAFYQARAVSRFLVSHGYAQQAYTTVVYTPGKQEPYLVQVVGVTVEQPHVKQDMISFLPTNLDWRPEAIVERFDLTKPQYQELATFGEIGNAASKWEGELE